MMNLGESKRREAVDYKKHTGLFEFEVLGFNPTKEVYKQVMGIEKEEEPVYTGKTTKVKIGDEEIEVPSAEITVLLKGEIPVAEGEEPQHIIIPHTIYFSDHDRVSKSGSEQMVNNHGVCSFPSKATGEMPDWFNKVPNRKAMMGEENLYQFLNAWLNLNFKDNPEASIIFERADILSGKAAHYLHTEVMKNIAITEEDGERIPWKVQGLVGINEAGYMTVYKKFLSESARPNKYFIEELTSEYGFKADYQGTFEIKESTTPMKINVAQPNGGDTGTSSNTASNGIVESDISEW